MAGFSKNKPLVSFIIPTLNAGRVLPSCLNSITIQNYKNYEIIIIDGGSTDQTIAVAKKFKCRLFKNPLKTGESGKAIGIKKARGRFIALVDSDNILPDQKWLSLMIMPLLTDSSIFGSEPWEYTYRPKGGFIERYSALTGVNDPYCLIIGNFDRRSYLNSQWTRLPLKLTNYRHYQIAALSPNTLLPTIGANGTVFRTDCLKKYFTGDYFFDIDIIETALKINLSSLNFAKVKIGIIHTFCESSIAKFIIKQQRRAVDLYTYQHLRQYSLAKNNFKPTLIFVFYVVLIFPMLWDTLRGFIKKPDPAWLFHPVACIITLYIYSLVTIKNYLGILKPVPRGLWQQ